jgi:hypothetical protein
MDQLLQQAQVLSQTGNADARQKTSLALMKLAYALESADDMIQRIGALVKLLLYCLEPLTDDEYSISSQPPSSRVWI